MADEIVKPEPSALVQAGQAANRAASEHIFENYQIEKPQNTLRAQRSDLHMLARFLLHTGAATGSEDDVRGELYTLPARWEGMTFGILEAFKRWLLQEGYSIASINRALATAKVYCNLAYKAGVLSECEYRKIQSVKGYSPKAGRRVDEKRDTTRVGKKKEQHTTITPEQAERLKQHPDTPQGRRDALLMCLLLDHGLRMSEIFDLQVGDINLGRAQVTFYRRKTDLTQTHRLSADTLKAAQRYIVHDAPPVGKLFLASKKDGSLTDRPMALSTIGKRVNVLGEAIGIERLSPHDCRHYWATREAERGTSPLRLQEAGGWSSLEMPRRYIERSEIANEGMV